MPLRLRSADVIGAEIALRWDDDSESYIPLEKLRRHCPCATCAGEKDLLGKVYGGNKGPLTDASFRLQRLDYVGGYGLQPKWGDGHSTGIFSYDYLKALAE